MVVRYEDNCPDRWRIGDILMLRSMYLSLLYGLCVVLFLFAADSSHAQTVSLGVPSFPKDLNILTSNHPAGHILRSAMSGTLLKAAGNKSALGYKLLLADSISTSPDQKRWSFRLRNNVNFYNGQRIVRDDVVYSLDRCIKSGILEGVKSVESRREDSVAGTVSNWFDFQLSGSVPSSFPLSLSKCPIIESRSAELFGSELGLGSNLVSAGQFALTEMILGKQYTLHRLRGNASSATEDVVIRGFEDPKHALTALRLGTLDGIFVSNSGELEKGVLEKAENDSTLEVSTCLANKFIARKGFHIGCDPDISLSEVGYVG